MHRIMIWMYPLVQEASDTATRAENHATRAESEVSALRRRSEHLALACQALWELLRETTGLTDDRLRAKMQEIDLRDGTADGKIALSPVDCPACGARSNTRRTHCIMCGAQLEKEHAFG
jgi:hypothetical protein